MRRACRIVRLSRAAYYRPPMPASRRDATVIAALMHVVARYPRWGFWKCYDRLRLEGAPWNHKRVHRVYCALRLNLPRRAHVIFGAAGIFAGPRRDGRMREVTDDVDAAAKRLQRLQDFRELKIRAVACRRPQIHRRTVRHVDCCQPAARRCRRLRQRGGGRYHRIEQRQRDCAARPAQDGASREAFLRYEHRSRFLSYSATLTFMRKGTLSTIPRTSAEKR